MNRHSHAVPVIPETTVLPFPGTEGPPEPKMVPEVNRVATIEPGIGCIHIRYRDEHGHPLLDLSADYRLGDDDRQWLRRMLQGIGDQLASTVARTTPLPVPRLLR